MRREVHKFGGTSVGSAERMKRLVTLVEARRAVGVEAVVVVSAMAGVTDALVALVDGAQRGEPALDGALDALRARHIDAWQGVAGDVPMPESFTAVFDELTALATAVRATGEASAAVRDRCLAAGERLAAQLVAAAFRAGDAAATPCFADGFVETDAAHGEANPLPGLVDLGIRSALEPILEAGTIPVVTGFCGISPEGRTTTLGRGGSDFTATIVGAAIRADEVWIWTDVDGVYTADPRDVPDATSIPQLNYREAAELAFFGAKVLHPRTLEPVATRGIPVRILSTFAPDAEGTIVDARLTPGSHPVKGLSAVRRHTLVSLEGRGIAGVPGAAARLFTALADAGVSVTMISQSNAESSITVAVPSADADRAERALRSAFRLDLAHGVVGDISLRPSVGLVAAVGIGMANAPGISARVFGALARARINVLAIAQGSSELNISLAVDDRDTAGALRALHDAFGLALRDTGVESAQGADLIVHGTGAVARALVGMLLDRHADLRARTGLDLRVVALTDRTGLLFSPGGLTPDQLRSACEAKASGASLANEPGGRTVSSHADALAEMLAWRLRRPIVLDLSSDTASAPLLEQALEARADVVTANKWPLAGPLDAWESLFATARERARVVRYEATVGAGLPVIDTIEMLLATGDRIRSIEGCLSGTLSWVLEQLGRGARFSDAVIEARRRGYTETDPVLDLVGGDVGRKVVIAARTAGLPLDANRVDVTPLVDRSLLGLPADALHAALQRWDVALETQIARERDAGRVARYVGRVADGQATVGLRFVDASSPLYDIAGTDNRIVIHSERYDERPLTVTGPGAGIDVTAMGVLGDLLRVLTVRRREVG